MIAYIVWNVRPELVSVGPLTVRWYGVLFAILFWAGFLIVRWQFRSEGKNEEDLSQLLTHLVLGTIIGARLGHCLFYEPGYYLSHPWDIPKVWEGGLASHGGALGVLFALWLYCRKRPDQPYLWLLDRICVPTALAGCLIRLGNLFNSEILGNPTQMPWGFVFVRVDAVARHPVQLYEATAYAATFVVLLLMYRRWRAQTPVGWLVGWFLVLVFSARFLLEFFKEEQAAYGQSSPLHVGQWLSIPFIGAGLFLIARARRRNAGRPAQT